MKTEKNSTYKLGFGSRVSGPTFRVPGPTYEMGPGSRVSGPTNSLGSSFSDMPFLRAAFFNTLIKLNQTHFDQFS